MKALERIGGSEICWQ